MHVRTLNPCMHTHIMFIRLHEIAHIFTYDLILVWQQINCSKFNMSRKIIIFGRMLPFLSRTCIKSKSNFRFIYLMLLMYALLNS
jgi:hypothetical protein